MLKFLNNKIGRWYNACCTPNPLIPLPPNIHVNDRVVTGPKALPAAACPPCAARAFYATMARFGKVNKTTRTTSNDDNWHTQSSWTMISTQSKLWANWCAQFFTFQRSTRHAPMVMKKWQQCKTTCIYHCLTYCYYLFLSLSLFNKFEIVNGHVLRLQSFWQVGNRCGKLRSDGTLRFRFS